MKKISTIITASILMFSCTKENLSIQEHKIESHIKSVEVIAPGEKRITYDNSGDVLIEKYLGEGRYHLSLKKEGKILELNAIEEKTEHFTRVKAEDMGGREYYHFVVNENNVVQTMTIVRSPFACYNDAVETCSGNWYCRIICFTTPISFAACSVTWLTGCEIKELKK